MLLKPRSFHHGGDAKIFIKFQVPAFVTVDSSRIFYSADRSRNIPIIQDTARVRFQQLLTGKCT